MNILVVNDDGYEAKGIEILVKALSQFGDVYVSAPKIGQSGKSQAITIRQKIKVEHVTPISGSIDTIAVDGYPADAVSIGLKAFDVDFDVCVSGINYGHNIATDVFYSGTVGAAREAKFMGIPSIAISAANPNLTYLLDETITLMDEVFTHQLHMGDYVLNINFPTERHKKPKGVRITTLGRRLQYSDYIKASNEEAYHPKHSINYVVEKEDSDVIAVNEGFISLTPLSLDITDHESRVDLIAKMT